MSSPKSRTQEEKKILTAGPTDVTHAGTAGRRENDLRVAPDTRESNELADQPRSALERILPPLPAARPEIFLRVMAVSGLEHSLSHGGSAVSVRVFWGREEVREQDCGRTMERPMRGASVALDALVKNDEASPSWRQLLSTARSGCHHPSTFGVCPIQCNCVLLQTLLRNILFEALPNLEACTAPRATPGTSGVLSLTLVPPASKGKAELITPLGSANITDTPRI